MKSFHTAPARQSVTLGHSVFRDRFYVNRAYVASLRHENLLQNYLAEAGLSNWMPYCSQFSEPDPMVDRHWGWESPSCQVRGHFLGHWMSAAAQIWAATGDVEMKWKLNAVVADLARCQERNGGEWCSSLPEKYMTWLATGAPTWAPQYVVHKILMGLHDAWAFGESELALQIADRMGDWFYRWIAQFPQEQMDNILDCETGGMLEVWANLYAATSAEKYLTLMERYTRRRLFEPLLKEQDMLTNMHANTTIPEAHGIARCYEVSGDERYKQMVEAYWKCAVTDRGTFCTGGQNSGEIWTPPFEFAARRGDKTQEHCTVYNMIRLADYLFRWTGKVEYLDYIERNLYNGILAQQHSVTGQLTYWLPLEAGAKKKWGHPTHDFWCCHGSLVQAHAMHGALTWYLNDEGVTLAQYQASELRWEHNGQPVKLTLEPDHRNHGNSTDNSSAADDRHRPMYWSYTLRVECGEPVQFALTLRLPKWITGETEIKLNGKPVAPRNLQAGFMTIEHEWQNDIITIRLPFSLYTEAIPDEPETVAFLAGPVVLAGLCEDEICLYGAADNPEEILKADNEREWGNWLSGYRTIGQAKNIRFKPLYEVIDERFTLYFPMR